MAYARDTKVSVSQSEIQIKALLRKHGATTILIGDSPDMIAVQFAMHDRHIRFVIPIPSLEDDEIKFTDSGKVRDQTARQTRLKQVMRQRYRLLFLVVKAKLEAVASGVIAFEDEFLAHTIMSDGKTVGEWAKPQIARMYETGDMPPLLGYR